MGTSYYDPYGLSALACCVLGTSELGESALRAAEAPRHVIGTARDFLRNYRNMRTAGRELVAAERSAEGNDKYFHCRANCDAAQRGRVGRFVAGVISDVREAYDQTKGDSEEASQADQEANRRGRDGARDGSGRSCQQVCETYRPRHLPERY